ncbi:MAG: alpha/beta hydrolase [Planctomycetaceae bacterium]
MSKLAACFLLLLLTSIPDRLNADDWRTIRPDVIYSHKAGMALTYDVVRPTRNPNGAAVLFMVSGGWVSIWAPPETVVRTEQRNLNLFEKIVDRGYTLFLVRHGSSPWFKVPEAVADVRLAIRHIRKNAAEYQIDPERIGVCGGSAGGHLALALGTMGDDGDPDAAVELEKTSSRVQAVGVCVSCRGQ